MFKKIFIGGLIASLSLQATPVGNTAAPELIQRGIFASSSNSVDLRLGYEGDMVSDGRMNQYWEGSGRVDRYRENTNSGTVTFNLVDRLDIYGVFGSSNTRADWRITEANGDIHRLRMKTFHALLWAAGARAILYEWNHFFLGMGGRYSRSHYHPAWMTTDGNNVSVSGAYCIWKDWQINLDLAYKIKLLTPYIGVKYSHSRTKLGNFSVPIANDGSGSNHFKNRVPVGVYVGCAISNGEYLMVNLEARLTDEEAVTLSADVRF